MDRTVVIVGAGIIGAAVARSLAQRGVGVTVIDRGAAGSGTSAAGEGNLLVSDKGPGPELDLAQYSAGLWPVVACELADELGPQFPSVEFDPKGGLVVTVNTAEATALDEFSQRQRRAGVRAEPLDAFAARTLEPELSAKITSAMYYPQDAQVQPTLATEALLASARRRGARILLDTPVTGPVLDHDGRLVGVMTPSGELRADAVVVAAGPWSREVAQLLGGDLPVRPRKGILLVTSRMSSRIHHKVYDADYVGAVGADSEDLHTSSVIESTASGTVLIGSSRQRVGFDSSIELPVVREIAAKALRLFPFLADEMLMRTYCGFRPYLPDHLPAIGEDRDRPGLWYATGHEGAGIGLAPATGELLAALLTGEEPGIDCAAFSPSRDALVTTVTGER